MLEVTSTLTSGSKLLAERTLGLAARSLDRLVDPIGSWLTELSDQADAVWEPFLTDEPSVGASA